MRVNLVIAEDESPEMLPFKQEFRDYDSLVTIGSTFACWRGHTGTLKYSEAALRLAAPEQWGHLLRQRNIIGKTPSSWQ